MRPHPSLIRLRLAILILVPWIAQAEDGSYQPLPMPKAENSFSWRAFHLRQRAWLLVRERDEFMKRNAGKEWAADGAEYVARQAAIATHDPATAAGEQRGRLQKLIDAGCDDPLILGDQAAEVVRAGDLVSASKLYEAAIKACQASRYPASDLLTMTNGLFDVHVRRRSSLPLFKWIVDLQIDAAWKAMTERSDDSLVGDFLALSAIQEVDSSQQSWWVHEKGIPYSTYSKLLERIEAHPDEVAPWLRDTVRGQIHIRLAWQARGSGWAKDVSEAGQQEFAEHLAEAGKFLTAAWTADPNRPQAAAAMITQCMGASSGHDEERRWFDRALAAQLDYDRAFSILRRALLPRWGGDYEMIEALGAEALATGRFDTGLPNEYFLGIIAIAEDMRSMARGEDGTIDDATEKKADGIWSLPQVWKNLRTMFEGYRTAKVPWEGYDRAFNDSWYCTCAWLAGEHELARRLLAELGDQARLDIFRSFQLDLAELRGKPSAEAVP